MEAPTISQTPPMTEAGRTVVRVEATRPPTPGCPACGGSLNPAGGVWRCGRCRFALCVGCCVDGPAGGE